MWLYNNGVSSHHSQGRKPPSSVTHTEYTFTNRTNVVQGSADIRKSEETVPPRHRE